MIHGVILYNNQSGKIFLEIISNDKIQMNGAGIAGIFNSICSYITDLMTDPEIYRGDLITPKNGRMTLTDSIIVQSINIFYPKNINLIVIYDEFDENRVSKLTTTILSLFIKFFEKYKKVDDTNLSNIKDLKEKVVHLLEEINTLS